MRVGRVALPVVLGLALGAACTPPSNTTQQQGAPSAAVAPVRADELIRGDAAFQRKLREAIAARGADYQARTRHKNPDGSPKYVNRLILEGSPYLLQHAHNPVAWFPWGDEAFRVAKELGRPVFLSVGYSTCHWCHVMEEESFEDEEIAAYINEHYVPIKVDREERPDVDAVYMHSVQLLTGKGGWPMSVWLTPERKPFYGGTYFAARDGDRGVKKGFLTLLKEQQQGFARDPNGIANDAERLAVQVQSDLKPANEGDLPSDKTLRAAAAWAVKRYDPEHGGPKGRPKFPSSFPIRLLLRHAQRASDKASLDMALHALRAMQAGGIYDHVAGGFHRYAVDDRWLVPHFEKMLYDQALIALAYLEGFQASKDAELERVAREILDYVDREMTTPLGGYYSATDADSLAPNGKREEGYYFTWTPAEIDAALGPARGKILRGYYGVSDAGNFEGRNILFTAAPRAEAAKSLGVTLGELDSALGDGLPLLRTAREARPRPLRDDKLQVSWNGLMIAAMARGARVLGEPRYRQSAEKAARLVLDKMMPSGRLRHSFLDGRPSATGFAEDHAFLGAGLVELFQATQEPRWLDAALSVMNLLEEHHKAESGGYYRTSDDHEQLLAREIESRDGALPSAGSVAAMTQLYLWTLTGQDAWRKRAERTMRAVATTVAESPWMLDEMMLAVDYSTDSPKEVMLALPDGVGREDRAAVKLLEVLRGRFVPNSVLVVTETGTRQAIGQLVPWAADKPPKKGEPTVYVCELGACELPTTDPAVFAKQLGRLVPYAPAK
jgi:uncharacterized protein YyaL (SSP411 family)